MKRRALISVTDKAGVVDFARGLVDLGFEVLSTGGTFRVLRTALAFLTPNAILSHRSSFQSRTRTVQGSASPPSSSSERSTLACTANRS